MFSIIIGIGLSTLIGGLAYTCVTIPLIIYLTYRVFKAPAIDEHEDEW